MRAKSGGNPPKITITHAMLRAGALAYSEYDSRFEGLEEAAARVFTAMAAVAGKMSLAALDAAPRSSALPNTEPSHRRLP